MSRSTKRGAGKKKKPSLSSKLSFPTDLPDFKKMSDKELLREAKELTKEYHKRMPQE